MANPSTLVTVRRFLEILRTKVGDFAFKTFHELELLKFTNTCKMNLVHVLPGDYLWPFEEELLVVPQEDPVNNKDGSFGATLASGLANPPANGNTNYTRVPIPAITGNSGTDPVFTLPDNFARPGYVHVDALGETIYAQISGMEQYVVLTMIQDQAAGGLDALLTNRGFWWIADNRLYMTKGTGNNTFTTSVQEGAKPEKLHYYRFPEISHDITGTLWGQPVAGDFKDPLEETVPLLAEMVAHKCFLALVAKGHPNYIEQAAAARGSMNAEIEALWARAGFAGIEQHTPSTMPGGRIG